MYGYLERADRDYVAGWAAGDGWEPIDIEILVDGEPRWSGPAENQRDDLVALSRGKGCFGFAIASSELGELPPSAAIVSVRNAITREDLPGSPRTMPTARLRKSAPQATPLPLPDILGCLDEVTPSIIRGWAFDKARPDTSVSIDIFVDDAFSSRHVADQFRGDLKAAGFGSGRCAFIAPTPISLFDGDSHIVRVVPTNQSRDFANSPRLVHMSSSTPFQHMVRLERELNDQLMEFQRRCVAFHADAEHAATVERASSTYFDWHEKFVRLTSNDREDILRAISRFGNVPTISILMPTYNTDPSMLRAAIESVRSQLYPHWQLCIADDNSTKEATLDVIREYSESDARIKIALRKYNGHISEATNTALTLATGDYVAFLDHDDLLTEDALFYMAAAAIETGADLLYSDEDKIDNSGIVFEPHFKPAFNYTLLLSLNYICHFVVARRHLVNRLGGLRTAYNGSQDHDLLLRLAAILDHDKIVHVPHVLYHWRSHQASTAQSSGAKSYTADASVKAIAAHLVSASIKANVSTEHGYFHTKWPAPAKKPLVSIIIPTRDCAKILSMCMVGLLNHTNYSKFEIIIVDNGSVEDDTFRLFKELSVDKRVRIVKFDRDFNYSEICNFGASLANGDLLLMLNNDVEAISEYSDWLDEMVSQIARTDIGAVGAKLLYPNRQIQHAGVILGIGGVAGHAHKNFGENDFGYISRLQVAQELSCCTAACLLLRRSVFEQIGGFDAINLKVAFNDVDLCMRIRQAGYQIVYTPAATLVHHESYSRGAEDSPAKILRSQREANYMLNTWAEALTADPAYSPSLTLEAENFSIDPNRGPDRSFLWRTRNFATHVTPLDQKSAAPMSSSLRWTN